jgi:hypothetical protein
MTRRAPYGRGQLYGIEAWRAAAANAFAQGADGVSLFNLFPQPGNEAHNEMVRQAFSELGDPASLAGKAKLSVLDNAAHLDNCGYTNHTVPYAECLPKLLESGKPTAANLFVSEAPAPAKGKATLRVQSERDVPLTVRLNDVPIHLEPATDLSEAFGLSWRHGLVPVDATRDGNNKVVATLPAGTQSTQLTGLELFVQQTR